MNLKNKIIVGLISFLLLFLALFFFVIAPIIYQLRKTGQAMKEQEKTVNSLEKRIAMARDFRSFYNKEKDNFSVLDEIFINPQIPTDFIDFLDETANSYNLNVSYFLTAPAKLGKDLWPSLGFQIITVGPFSSSTKFIKKLESSIYLLDIQSVEISKAEVNESDASEIGSVKVKTNISAKIYTK